MSPTARPPAARPPRAPTFTEKVGPSQRLWIEWAPESSPGFPPHCPCCLDAPSPGAHLQVRNKSATLRFDFPACATCVRHVAINARITDVMAFILLGLTVLTIAGGLVALGGWRGLLEPFRNAIRGAATLLVGMVVMVFWAFAVRWVLIWPLEKILGLNKPSCRWFSAPVQWGAFDKPLRSGLGFENLEYGRRFVRANAIGDGRVKR